MSTSPVVYDINEDGYEVEASINGLFAIDTEVACPHCAAEGRLTIGRYTPHIKYFPRMVTCNYICISHGTLSAEDLDAAGIDSSGRFLPEPVLTVLARRDADGNLLNA